MKLSEAISMGAMLGPQSFSAWQLGDATCAIGAAMAAVGIEDGLSRDVMRVWPWIFDEERASRVCPVAECAKSNRMAESVGHVIMHLNDNHRLTREQIADWVASVEPQEEQADGGPGLGVAALEVQAV